ncbi:MAG: CHAT domain-containing tetratricopeptide repeat protein [Bacteroidota bacterium]
MIIPKKVRLLNKSAILFMCLFLLPEKPFAQINADSLRADGLLLEAYDLAENLEYKKSNRKALQAAKIFRQLPDWKNWLECYSTIFFNGYYSRNFSIAIPHLRKCKADIPPQQSSTAARIDNYLAFAYDVIGDIPSSISAYKACVPVFLAEKDTFRLNKVYGNLGIAYHKLGDYGAATTYLNAAIASGRYLADTTTLYKNLNLLGDVFRSMQDFDSAEKYYLEAQRLAGPEDGSIETLLATLRLNQNKMEEAVRLAEEGVRLAAKAYGNELYEYVYNEEVLGDVYLYSGQYQNAIAQYQKLIAHYLAAENNREAGAVYVKWGDALAASDKIDEALSVYQNALKKFVPGFNKNNPASNPDKNLWEKEIWLMSVFKNKGQCFYQKYQSTKKEKWLYLAEENFQLAIDFIQNNLTANYDETVSKLLLGEYTQPCYESLIKSKLELFELTAATKYKNEAFQVAQKANAFVLRELLNEQQALQVVGVSGDTLQQLKQYRQQMFVLEGELAEAPSDTQDSLYQVLFSVKQSFWALKKAIEKNYPSFKKLRNDLEVPTVQQLQEKLDSSDLLVKYFIGEKSIYIFTVSPTDFQVEKVPFPKDFYETVFQYRRSVSDLDFIQDSTQLAEQQFLKASQKLYEWLLKKPLEQRRTTPVSQLIIVADDILHMIPFQALQWRAAATWDNPDDFIISKYAISYSYFCKLLLDDRLSGGAGYNFQSFGLEFDDYTLQYLHKISKDSINNKVLQDRLRSGTLSSLPFSDDEAAELAQLMYGNAWLNTEATKNNFLENIAGASIIHIATHSILDGQNSDLSSLVFIKTKDSLDNLLRINEIYDLHLNADMMVLSACNTSLGKYQKGEGLNSLARAFNYAGVESVVASLWSVSDEASKKLMLLFYQNLKAGMPKDQAMQRAQLEFLQNDDISSPAFRQPVYWAAWMVVGDNGQVPVGGRPLSTILVYLGLTLLAGGLLFAGRKYLINGSGPAS